MDAVTQLLDLVRQIKDALDPQTHLRMVFESSNLVQLARLLQTFVLSTQNANPQGGAFTSVRAIKEWEPLSRAVGDAGLVAMATWASVRMMWGHGLRNPYTVRLMLPRLMLAAVLVNFAVPLIQAAVDASNAASQSVVNATIHLEWQTLLNDTAKDFQSGPFSVLVALALFSGYLLLGIAYVVRYALLVVLAVVSPLAAALAVLPETQHYAREWGSLFVSTLLMQPAQLLILAIALDLDLDGITPIRHVFALAALVLAYKVPGALHSASSVGSHARSFVRGHLVSLLHAAERSIA